MGATGTLRYSYDAAGLLSSQTDTATGETVTYAYDRAGRRILMAGVGRETAYRYGRNGELLEVSDNRQRLSVSYKYDVMGRETERIFGNGVSQHTAYDKAGRVILITEKSGNNILLRGEGYVYDSLGRRSATVSHSGAVTRYEYNPAGQLAKVQYPDSQELRDLQEQEARQHGLFWQESVSGLSNGHLSTSEYTELSRLFVRMRNGSGFLPTTQVFRTEMYTYDANGNRATKTTAYGTITYSYDAENRLQKTCGNTGVGVEYAYDSNGNLLSQTSSLKHSIYEYNPQNRMVRSRVVDDEARTIASTRYGYDPLGRRTLVQDNNAATLRTLYDGLSFDVVKESPVYASGGFVDTYNTGIQYSPAGYATGERYRYLDDGVSATSEKYQYIEDSSYQTVSSRYSGERTMLYAHGSPVAINRSGGTRGYLGTDILGSTRSVTDNHGLQESYYDYDIFGSPVAGDFTTGADYGYLGKPYDSITGLYNYGYRDYSPQTVRFTTVDPIRDGTNWFAYVNNDPVNYVDLWGLLASEGGRTVPNTWRDNKDGTYTALPGATLYELYGENWREESGYVGNPSNLQVGDVVGRKSSFMENSVSQPIVNSKQEVLVIDNSFPQVTNSEEIFEGYSHRTNIAIGVTEIVLGVGIIVSSTITTGTINVVSGGMTTIPAGWAIIEGWAAGSTFIALGITRLSNANNSRVSDDIKQVFIPSVVDVAEGIDDVSKGQEQ